MKNLRLTHVSASAGPNPTVQLFRNELPDYKHGLRKIFKEYANRELGGALKFSANGMPGTDQSRYYEEDIQTHPQSTYAIENDVGYPPLPSAQPEALSEPIQDKEIVPDFSPEGPTATNSTRAVLSVPSIPLTNIVPDLSTTVSNTTENLKK